MLSKTNLEILVKIIYSVETGGNQNESNSTTDY